MSPSRPAAPSPRRSAGRSARSHRLPRAAAAAGPTALPQAPQHGTGGGAHQELVCSLIGLTVKVGLGLVAVVSLVRLTGAYQTRMDRYGEISAVLGIQQAKLLKAQNRFDRLFATGGEQRLIEEQDQWIAPNRLRVVWQAPQPERQSPFPTVERPLTKAVNPTTHP